MYLMHSAVFLLLACVAAAQRSPYASRPIPSLLPRYRPDDGGLGNRVGVENSTPLPSHLQGTLEEDQLVQRVSEWPEEKQPFWFKNRNSISAQREQSVDGTFGQAPRPRPPFAGGQQTIDRGDSEIRQERPSFNGAQHTFNEERYRVTEKPFSSEAQLIENSQIRQEGYRATERPSFNGAQQSIGSGNLQISQHRATERPRPSSQGFQQSTGSGNTQAVHDTFEISDKPAFSSGHSQINQQGFQVQERPRPSYGSGNSQIYQQEQRPIRKKERVWGRQQQNEEISRLFDHNKETYREQHRRKPSTYHDFVQKPQMR